MSFTVFISEIKPFDDPISFLLINHNMTATFIVDKIFKLLFSTSASCAEEG